MQTPSLDKRRVALTVAPRRVAVLCGAVAVGLFVIDLVISFAVDAGADRGALMPRLFDTDLEANLPTWFSATVLVAGALAAFVKAQHERGAAGPWNREWTGLAVLLLVLSIDEAAVIHEETVGPLDDVVESLGFAGDAARLIAVAVVVVGLAAMMLPLRRWLLALPAGGRNGMIAGLVLIGACALGMETVARLLEQSRGFYGLADDLLSSVEELGEMLGASVLLVTTLSLLPE